MATFNSEKETITTNSNNDSKQNESESDNKNDNSNNTYCQCCTGFSPERNIKRGFGTLKIDIHAHILPEVIPSFREEFGYGQFISLKKTDQKGVSHMWQGDKFFRTVDEKSWSCEARLGDMDADNVQVQVLSTVPVMFSYWAKPHDTLRVAKFLNDDIANRCKQYPTRFAGLGTLPMQSIPLAIQELRRCILELGLVGVQIGSHIEKWNLDDEIFFPLWKEAEKLNACIFIHPWDMMGEKEMGKYWLPWLVGMPAESARAICSLMFGGVFKKFPKLKFCIAHGGGAFPHTIGRIEHGYNCRPDLIQINIQGATESPLQWLGHFWVDSLVHSPEAFEYLIQVIGQDRIVLGTDYPFPLGECYPLKDCGELVEQYKAFEHKDKKQVLWYNGLEFIGKNENDFLKKPSSTENTQKSEQTTNETQQLEQQKTSIKEESKESAPESESQSHNHETIEQKNL